MEKWMVAEHTNKLKATFIQANLMEESFMGVEDLSWKMEISMKVNFLRENLTVRENWALQTEMFMKESLRMAKGMERELLNLPMATFTKENSREIRFVGKG